MSYLLYVQDSTHIKRGKNTRRAFLKICFSKEKYCCKHKSFSKAAKEILVKTMAQALPNFTMSVFLLSLDIYADLKRMLNSFWWGAQHESSKGIRWKTQANLYLPKMMGGIGFKKFREFNMAMVVKQGWRFINHLKTLVFKVFRASYFSDGNFQKLQLIIT